MSDSILPAVSLVPLPGRQARSLEMAREIERRGFDGIYVPSLGEALAFCQSLALVTERLRMGTSVVNLYARHPSEYARTAALVHELSGGRFAFGIGVSHGPMNRRLGVAKTRPLADTRAFVEALRATRGAGDLPPVVLAAMRDAMVEVAAELGDGLVMANAALSYVPHSLEVARTRGADPKTFFVGNMIPTCIHDDRAAAAARNRRTMLFYAKLPNYRRYWKAAGYVGEMEAVEAAIERGDDDAIGGLLSDRWLADCTLFGPAAHVRERVEAWRDAGVTTPILVPSSAEGNQAKAFEELFAAFA